MIRQSVLRAIIQRNRYRKALKKIANSSPYQIGWEQMRQIAREALNDES